MSRRDHVDARCPRCAMQRELCICALVPTLATRARLLLLVHYDEARKPTNTGQLAARCLARADIGIIGDRERPLQLPLVRAGEQPILLFPDDDARPLAELVAHADPAAPIALIVPDGNWRQASKMRRRVPGLADVPCATLPIDAGPSSYRLRAEPRAGGLATLEAIARALRIIEGDGDGDAGPAIEAALLAVFRVMVERTLWSRGAISDDEVTGGIPDSARAARLNAGRS